MCASTSLVSTPGSDRLTTVVIEICTACGQPAVDDL